MPEELPCSSYTSKLKMLKKQGKKTFGLGLSNLISQRTIYKDNKKTYYNYWTDVYQDTL